MIRIGKFNNLGILFCFKDHFTYHPADKYLFFHTFLFLSILVSTIISTMINKMTYHSVDRVRIKSKTHPLTDINALTKAKSLYLIH